MNSFQGHEMVDGYLLIEAEVPNQKWNLKKFLHIYPCSRLDPLTNFYPMNIVVSTKPSHLSSCKLSNGAFELLDEVVLGC